MLNRFGTWLAEEAVPAGGVADGDLDRIGDRHLLDSLAFLQGLEGIPADLLDVGSGVGLPGIPLAVMLPETSVTLLDRSARRVRLARRAVRVLGLDNVVVEQGEAGRRAVTVLTIRALMDPAAACRMVEKAFPVTRAVVALTRGGAAPQL
ncbi:MAG: class I SAM-dependent methyltransferase, partial [Acidimicrobiia bacterium]|nr:class I SAM-dependent methyltransferase [Acidimicrobiia bacterium]